MKNAFSILLCEGVSDLAFISLFLINKLGYSYVTKGKRNILVDGKSGEHSSWYSNGEIDLLICSVGGCDKFNNFYNKYIQELFNDVEIPHLIVVKNADEDVDAAFKSIAFSGVEFELNKWHSGQYLNAFGFNVNYKSYIRVIPEHSCGALETLVIEALLVDEPDIAKSAIDYVDTLSPEEAKYLDKKRYKLKAKIGIMMNLIDPQRTFSSLTNKFSLLNFSNALIVDCFNFLSTLTL